MLDLPVGPALRVILHTGTRQLRGTWVFAKCQGTGRSIALGGAVAYRAVLAEELDACDQVGSVRGTGFGPLGASLASVARSEVRAAQCSSGSGPESALVGMVPVATTK